MPKHRVFYLGRHVGLTFAPYYREFGFDHWPGYWMITGLGACLWRDTSNPVTVGERGAW